MNYGPSDRVDMDLRSFAFLSLESGALFFLAFLDFLAFLAAGLALALTERDLDRLVFFFFLLTFFFADFFLTTLFLLVERALLVLFVMGTATSATGAGAGTYQACRQTLYILTMSLLEMVWIGHLPCLVSTPSTPMYPRLV